ncbi:hypothetical protein EMIT0P258_190042 [Pseudomonas sp. IT-P258]
MRMAYTLKPYLPIISHGHPPNYLIFNVNMEGRDVYGLNGF